MEEVIVDWQNLRITRETKIPQINHVAEGSGMRPEVLDRLVAESAGAMAKAIEQQLTDALTRGQGFVKQTNFPLKVEHAPYLDVVRVDGVT